MKVGEHFQILAELGAGGMGIVYQGVDESLEREVAIKKLRSEFSRSADVAERFRKEAVIQARLNHPNLAHLYSFFKDGDSFYIAMEFVEGTPLSRFTPLPWKHALWIFLQVLEGLEYAHSEGVLHRDVKPDNIMIGPRGEVKVMDFGIAHVLGSTRQTRDKSIVGTLEYMPPEQIEGKEIGAWSDIYSLGIMLFEIVSGRLPFTADGEFEMLKHHLETPPPKLSEFVPDAPAFLETALARAMKKNPKERFPSCRAFADFIKQAAPEVALATADSFPHQVRAHEVERCVSRIEALLNGGRLGIAARAVGRARVEYPDQPQIQRMETRLRDAEQAAKKGAGNAEKTEYIRRVLTQLREFEREGAMAPALKMSNEAVDRYPEVQAFQIASAIFKKSN
jgi:serine/threonine protein kinase